MTLTPEQFNKLVTRDDLNHAIDWLVSKEEFSEFKNDFYSTMDTVIKKLDNIEHSFVSNMVTHDRFETRITQLEKQGQKAR